jgi:hypothetical protein
MKPVAELDDSQSEGRESARQRQSGKGTTRSLIGLHRAGSIRALAKCADNGNESARLNAI